MSATAIRHAAGNFFCNKLSHFMLPAATDQTDSFRRRGHFPAAHAAGSNGTHPPRRRTLTQAMSADSSPTKASSNRPPGNWGVKNLISKHEDSAKRSNGGAIVVEDSNYDRQAAATRSGVPAPAASKSSANRSEQSLKNSSAKSDHFVSEITELSRSLLENDPPLQYEDHVSKSHLQKLMDRRAPSINMSRNPYTASRPVETGKHENVRAVQQNGLSRSNLLDERAIGDRKSLSTAPSRRHGQMFSQSRSSSSGSRRAEQPESRSSSTASRQAERRRFGGSHGNNPSLMQEASRRSSPSSRAGKSKPSSNDDDYFDFEFKVGSNFPTTKSSSSDISDEEEPANSAMQSHARHRGANGLKTAGVDLPYTNRLRSGVKSRHEDATDLDSGLTQKIPSISYSSKQGNGSLVPVGRPGFSGVLKPEDQPDGAHRKWSQDSFGGNLKQDIASGASSSEGSIDDKTLEVVQYRPPASVKRHRNPNWPLQRVAAASYNGGWLPYDAMVPYPDDIANLNKFLNDCRYEVEAGVPGRFLTVVLGNEKSDLDSIMSTITYAFLLSSRESQESKVFVPVINMRQEDMVLHTEAVWLFKVTGLDTSKLLFVDQISLQYYHRFGNLKLVLVDHSRLAPHQETLQDAVIEIVDHNLIEELYPWVPTTDIQQVGSCCTIIAERFVVEAPQHLSGRGLNRLLLGPILLDTANLDPKSARCTSRDMCMAAFLINGAGRYGQQGFFRLLRRMKFDISSLSTIDVLRQDLKRWTMGPGKSDAYGLSGRVVDAAMSTLGVPLREIMTRTGILEDLRYFGRKLKLDLHLIVTGYYDYTNRYKREILLVPGDIELRDHLRTCFRPHKLDLQLSYIVIPGLPEDMLVYNQGLVTASRAILRQILKDYFEM